MQGVSRFRTGKEVSAPVRKRPRCEEVLPVAPAGLNILFLLIAIGLAVAAGAVLAVYDIRRSSRPAPRLVSESQVETAESKRRVA